jgi:iduronate 2-sulfatase
MATDSKRLKVQLSILMRFVRSLLVACVYAGCAHVGAAEMQRPNVLFIVADDLRPDLGCYGNGAVHSPNIDRLASRGLVFDRAYCQVALCNPSRASLLTGRRPDATRVLDNGAHFRAAIPDVVTLPQFFKDHGYHAQALGKIYHPGCNDLPSWSVPSWDAQAADEDAEGLALVEVMKAYYGPGGQTIVQQHAEAAIKAGKDPRQLKRRDLLGPPWEAPDVADDDLVDGQTAKRAIEVLGELKDRPFFLAVGFLKPHLPFVAPKRYWDLYPPEQIVYSPSAPSKDVPPCALHEWSELRAFADIPKTGPLNDEQGRQMIRGYRAATSYTDAQIGRLLAELDRLGLREKTIVIFLGDHGWQLGEHGLWCKHTNFEVATRAPLILSVPGMKAQGRHTGALVEFVDIYPTLAELAGLPQSPHCEGTSFAPLLSNPAQPWKKAAFSDYLRPGREKFTGRSVRTEHWRYTEWVNDKEENAGVELYDHQTDPDENRNMADRPEFKAVVAEMARALHGGWREAIPAK